MALHIITGSGAPSTAPAGVGHHYIDTVNKVSYISVGTSSAADWETSEASGAVDAHVALSDPHAQYALESSLGAVATSGDHTDLSNVGTNTHAQIDAHVASTANPHSVTKSQVGLGSVDDTSDLDKPISNATQTALNTKQATISAFTNQMFYYDSEVQGFPGLFRSNEGGVDLGITINPDGEFGGVSINQNAANLNATSASGGREYFLNNNQINVDTDNDGFEIGTTNGRLVSFFNNSFSHTGSSDIGSVGCFNNYFNIGNGTDPITVDGFYASQFFANINAGVTVDGSVGGYTFSPNISSGAILSSTAFFNAFGDFSNIGVDVPGYNSINLSPTLSGVVTGTGVIGLNINPTIGTCNGTSSVSLINIAGTVTEMDTGFFSGITINPTVSDCQNAAALICDATNITASGSKYAAQFTGDVTINGGLSFSGALSIGQLNAFAQINPSPAIGGNPTVIHGLTTGVLALDSTTTADADTIGVSTAMLMTLEDNAVLTSGPFQLGLTALALPCIVSMGAGSSVQHVSGTTSAINLTTSAGGTIDHMRITRSVAIPNGVTTVNHSYGYFYHEPFGAVSSDNFSFYGEDAPAFLESGLKVGGIPGTTDRPDSGLVFHVEGDSQLDGDIGFFGTTPASQQTGGAATAGGTYGATEQTMLQTVYDALRTYGLLT